MAVDKAGFLHLSGNMHASPLTYFRMEKPGDVTTMKQIDAMVGKNEMRTTYPKFMTAPDGELLFHYRDGGSSRGSEIYNVYDLETKTWKRFLDTPLIDGEGKMNAYQGVGEQRVVGHLVSLLCQPVDASSLILTPAPRLFYRFPHESAPSDRAQQASARTA